MGLNQQETRNIIAPSRNLHAAGCARGFRCAEPATVAYAPYAYGYLRAIRNHHQKKGAERRPSFGGGSSGTRTLDPLIKSQLL